MRADATAREDALTAAEGTCPRCGGPRLPDHQYCLDCGLRLPLVTGRVASLRRRWIRRLGWYPGDWIWVALLTLAVAVAGGATAIGVTAGNASANGRTFTATSRVRVLTPGAVPTGTTAVDTSTLPTAPEPKSVTPPPRNGHYSWPVNENGWTIVLVSYPKTSGAAAAESTAEQAAKAGLDRAGILDSSSYASLQPGYYVVFTGVYGSKADADAAVPTARQAGFGGAYSRQIAR